MEIFMEKKVQHLKIFSYVAINLIDETILKINPIIHKFGYEFISLTIKELEQKFSDLIFDIYPGNINPKDNPEISSEFHGGYFTSPLFDHEVFFSKGKIYFLKSINHSIAVKEGFGIVGTIGGNEAYKDIDSFADYLITNFRILKEGTVKRIATFQFYETGGRYMHGFDTSERTFGQRFIIEDKDIPILQKLLSKDFKINSIYELAIKNLNLSYDIKNLETRYITLMTALESLFNRGRDQITHIVSRHLAIIVSSNKEDFEENYKNFKELYGKRSTIIHGDKIKDENLEELVLKLENLVRKAILFCLNQELNKDELFNYLNSKGYE